MSLRRIGLTLPPRPFALAGWSSWSLHRGSDTVERALSSHALFVRVRNMSAAILSPDLLLSSLRSTSALTSPEGWSSWSTPSSGSPERLPLASRCLGLGVVTWMAMLAPLARHCISTSPVGPFDAFQSAVSTRPSRATLRSLAVRPGLPLLALRVSRICQPCFMLNRPWAPSLQRFLPVRRRQILSDRAVLPAVSHHLCR